MKLNIEEGAGAGVVLVLLLFTQQALAGGYTTINNTYVDKSSQAMGACALGQAASQFHPSIFSKHHQYGIGVGHCDGDSSENAVGFGYARVLERTNKHAYMLGGSIGRSTDNVTALGFGFNSHFD